MTYLVAFIVCFIAGIGAGLGTGFAGMSAAAVISPMLITFLGMDPYMAVGIALASDVLASAVSAYTYGKSGNLDIKNGAVMMASVLCFTLVGSYVASLVPGTTMGGFSTFMTLLLGVKFIVRPVMTTKSAMNAVSAEKRFVQSLLCGAGVGFICGFIGAGGGMMMLLLLTSVLGYELKTAVGTSVFVMTFSALFGAASHFALGSPPQLDLLAFCVIFTLIWAQIAAKIATRASAVLLNRLTGIILTSLGIVLVLISRHSEPRHRCCTGRAGGGDSGSELFVRQYRVLCSDAGVDACIAPFSVQTNSPRTVQSCPGAILMPS